MYLVYIQQILSFKKKSRKNGRLHEAPPLNSQTEHYLSNTLRYYKTQFYDWISRIFHMINEQRSECDMRYLITAVIIEFTRNRIPVNFGDGPDFPPPAFVRGRLLWLQKHNGHVYIDENAI